MSQQQTGIRIDTSSITAGLKRLMEQTPTIIDTLLVELAKAIRDDARKRAPKDTGHLRRSIRYKRLGNGKVVIYAATASGALGREYAARVHEDLEQHHDTGEAKFLEHPLMEIGLKMPERIAHELFRRLADNERLAGSWKVVRDRDEIQLDELV
jgi:hypothetical protein